MLIGAIALLLLAMGLVAAELFLPSHGLLAIFAAVAAIGSVILAYKAVPGLALIFGLVIFVAAPVVFYWAVRIYPSTPVGKRVMLAPPPATGGGAADAASGFGEDSAKLEALVGRQGTAVTLLRPAGSISIEGRRIDAVSESEMIESGRTVEVVKVSGLRVIVKEVPPAT